MNANVLDPRHNLLDLSRVNSKFFPRTHLVDSLRHWANVQPTAPAFWLTDGETEQDETLSYAELDHAARAVAVEILKVANPGDRGILMYPPGLDFIIGFFGCLYAGCAAVPAFPPRRNRKGSRIQGIAQDCAAKFGLTVDATATQIMKDDASREDMSTMQLISSDRVDRSLAIQFSPVEIDPSEVAVLQYTSGSTGTPKGVVLTHERIIRNCEMIAYLFGQVHDEVGASWLPTYHDMGLVGGILSPVFLGLPLALMSPMSFLQRPVRWLRAITKYDVTMSGGPNFAISFVLTKSRKKR